MESEYIILHAANDNYDFWKFRPLRLWNSILFASIPFMTGWILATAVLP
jgi:hypothetical protein